MILYGYAQSSATYRVRIALNLKRLAWQDVPVDLLRNDQTASGYLALNPQGLVPTLRTDTEDLTQSLAICEYLDEIQPTPRLLPNDPLGRARVRAFAQAIACEIHPLQNLKVLRRLRTFGLDRDEVQRWARTAVEEGLVACEALVAQHGGRFCFGDGVTLADVVLIPQLANARRFDIKVQWPRLVAIEARCLALEAFRAAAPPAS